MHSDSSSIVCIVDCYISTGDGLVSIKSGWDEYGISFARPSSDITILRLAGSSGQGAGIALGSEMSGGISAVSTEGLRLSNSLHGIRIKTSPGRGGYIWHVYIADIVMTDVEIAVRITGEFGEHPDENFDRNTLPLINKITIRDVVGLNISVDGLLERIEGDNFSDICLANVLLNVTSDHHPWKCLHISGYSNLVLPESCEPLRGEAPIHSSACYVPENLRPQGFDWKWSVSS